MVEQAGKPSKRKFSSIHARGEEYTTEQVQFMMALDKRKRDNRTPYLEDWEILEVAKQLGYRKVGPNGTVSDAGS